MTANPSISLWDISAEEAEPVGTLDGDAVTELAVVGGGFTGLSTALHAAQRGLACHVLEAHRIGFGASGRNVGLVNAGLWLPPDAVIGRLGDTHGPALLAALSEAPSVVFALIERYGIRCEARRDGTIHAAHSPRGFEDLRRRAQQWRRLGAPVELLSREEAARAIGSGAFHGGLLDRRAGTINPMGYARGLARAAQGAGARISTGVTVRALSREGGRWRLRTDAGTLTARAVVLATNAYTDGLWPGLRNSYTPIRYFQVATAPLGARAASILRGGQGLWDTHPVMFSLRRDAFGRLLVGSMGRVIGGEDGLSRRWAARRLARLFPDLGPVAFETAWHGEIDMTPDHLPRIHRLAEDLYTAIGYNGRGIAPGTVFGRALAMLIAGGRKEDLPIPITPLQAAPGRRLMAPLYEAAFAANQLIRSL
ncbi:NAD(P)/FAD-dependent oxidoreductase [Methylobacterium nodulans]|uniref:FAD dependent oxidoreductase n=1 Tax=Methylobacterium nodulans (strain LMG 21967 / CNCM I-2342 / ORS 2060) TaxID=460265 RepID=B8IR97_METNO|nr:FAD-binding oxidoreductase [Methylobacterium nodulans]ACL58637.1 FAD dependent oxidoreductase [Methylobacterium nodulans ORS 2060]